MSKLDTLIDLTRRLGDPGLDMVIMAEGNTSAREDETTFWVKASGYSFQNADESHFVRVQFEPILSALSRPNLDDTQVRALLSESCVNKSDDRLPSVETFMHAYLLTLPGIQFVGHTHPTSFVSLMCLQNIEEFANERMFPDEIAFCGHAACFVRYVDPGLKLACVIRERVREFVSQHECLPKSIWLQNHGLITLGGTAKEVETAMLMQVKAARILLGALQTNHDIHFLTPFDVQRIHTRPDEHYRQKLLWEVIER